MRGRSAPNFLSSHPVSHPLIDAKKIFGIFARKNISKSGIRAHF
jgi:hypothetical protein